MKTLAAHPPQLTIFNGLRSDEVEILFGNITDRFISTFRAENKGLNQIFYDPNGC